MLTADGVFTLLGGQLGPAILQLLGGDEIDLTLQLGVQAGKSDLQRVVGLHHGAHDGPDSLLQEVDVAILTGDNLFPVPLIHIDGV